jgi:transposase
MDRIELKDGQWRLVEPLLPPERGRPGRPSRSNRAMVDVILWVHRTGSAWRDLPGRFGPWQSAWTRRAGEAIIADRGYDADWVIDLIERKGSEAVIPPRSHRSAKPRAFDAALHRERYRVEFFFNRLKQFRRVATRYENTARNYLAMVHIGCLRIWARADAPPRDEQRQCDRSGHSDVRARGGRWALGWASCSDDARRPRMRRRALLAAVVAGPAAPAILPELRTLAATERPPSARGAVDVLLVLAVDVSRSIVEDEARLQRQGYGAAVCDPDVARAVRGGPAGAVGIAYVEWTDFDRQRLVLPWARIASARDADAWAEALAAAPLPAPATYTSISGAIDFARQVLAEAPWPAARRVIDVSGDGPNNDGDPARPSRRTHTWRTTTAPASLAGRGRS